MNSKKSTFFKGIIKIGFDFGKKICIKMLSMSQQKLGL